MKDSLDSKLQIYSICSIRIRSRNWDIVEKPRMHNFDPCCPVEQKKKAAKEKAESEAHLKDEFYVNPEDEVEEWTPGK